MKRLFIAAAVVALSSSFALAGSSTPTLAIGAFGGGIYRSPTTMPITGLKNWSFGSLANLPFQILILRQGANTNTITTINSPSNVHASDTNVVIQNSSILTGFAY